MDKVYCQCGCEKEVKQGNKYVHGHARKGKVCSEETKAKMSVAQKGKKRSKKSRNQEMVG